MMARFQYQEAGSLGAGYCRGIQIMAVHTAMMSNIIAKARTPLLGCLYLDTPTKLNIQE
jgi:hypothetical protein